MIWGAINSSRVVEKIGAESGLLKKRNWKKKK